MASEESVKNNQLWYKSALDANQKPSSLTSFANTVLTESPNFSLPQTPVYSSNVDPTLKQSTDAPGGSKDLQATSHDGSLSEEVKSVEQEHSTEPPPQPVDNIPPSPFTLRASNCKKYQRPNRPYKMDSEPADSNSDKPTDTSAQDKPNSLVPASTSSTAASAKPVAKPAGRGGGRVRDYTVLHPSCVSVCNVTIQDSVERSIDELVPAATPADLGEAGQMKKKADGQPIKPTR